MSPTPPNRAKELDAALAADRLAANTVLLTRALARSEMAAFNHDRAARDWRGLDGI